MKFFKKARRMLDGAICLLAAFFLAFCVNGSMQLCLCDSDPDNCGEHCHECSSETEETCAHLNIQFDAPILPQTSVNTPQFVVALPPVVEFLFSESTIPFLTYSAAVSPPLLRGLYIVFSNRLYPLS
ncbi:MAG: hypothetical protein KIH06_07825 [Kiritimatiellae bacterium]|nr:hypothetical protein [Kiritimatiellia bacterium]